MLLIISPSPASFRIRKNFPRNIFFTRRPSLLGAVLCVITQPLHRSFAWRHNEWLLRILGGPFFSRCLLFCGVRCSYSNKNQNNPASLFWLCRQCEILCAHFPAAIHAWTWALVSRPRPPQPFLFPQVHSAICHFRNEKETGAEMRAAIVSGIVTGDAPFSYWPMFLPDPSNTPRILRES